MVVNVTLLTSLAPPPDEPDDEQAAISDADVKAARVIEPNLSLRMFTGHLLDPLMQEGWETRTPLRVGKNITNDDENSSMDNMSHLVNAWPVLSASPGPAVVPGIPAQNGSLLRAPATRCGLARLPARKRVVPATVYQWRGRRGARTRSEVTEAQPGRAGKAAHKVVPAAERRSSPA